MYWRQGIYLNWSPEAYCLVGSEVVDSHPESCLQITVPSCRKGMARSPGFAALGQGEGIQEADPFRTLPRLHSAGPSRGPHRFSHGGMVSWLAGD